jgi:tetratricopeptide (TPR) repeat protein
MQYLPGGNLGLTLATQLAFDAAEDEYRKAAERIRPIVEHRSNNNSVDHICISELMLNWSNLKLHQRNQPAEAITLVDEGLRSVEPLLGVDIDTSRVRVRVLQLHGTRAQALQQIGDHAAAVRSWRRVLDLCDPIERIGYRIVLALALVNAGDHAAAITE